jgi:tripartite-type tricarboxylate transporter receptor subunit TctC
VRAAIVGTAAGAQAPADGYTLTVITPAQIINTTLFAKPGYELRDFAPLALLNVAPALLLAHPKLGVNSVADVIAAAKAKPGAISFASQGTGVAPHLMMEMIKKAAGIDMVHVPYRGSAPALNDLVAGNVPLMMDSMITGLPHVRAGTLKGPRGLDREALFIGAGHSDRRGIRHPGSRRSCGTASWRRRRHREISCRSSAARSPP